MSNRRFIVFFLVGIVVLLAVSAVLEWRRAVAADGAAVRESLVRLPMTSVSSVEFERDGGFVAELVRGQSGGWTLERPFRADADESAVARALDAVLLRPVDDSRTAAEISALGASPASFGLDSPRFAMTLRGAGRDAAVRFGALSASGREVYASVDGTDGVFMLSSDVLSAFPGNADDLRPRALLPFSEAEVAGLDFRVPDAPFVKLVRQSSDWRLASPVDAPAEAEAVQSVVAALSRARIASFVYPSSGQVPPSGEAEAKVPRDKLAAYGLAVGAGLSVRVHGSDGEFTRISFGGRAGTNLVYALVGRGASVVTVDAALAEMCKVGDATFRDTSVFPHVDAHHLKSVSITAGSDVYLLVRGKGGAWNLESPVAAAADAAQAAAVVDKVLRLKQGDVQMDAAAGTNAAEFVRVSVATDGAVLPGATVRRAYFGLDGEFANLRSKTMFALDAEAARRLTMRAADREPVSVARDAEKGTWRVEAGDGAAATGRDVDQEAVAALLTALARVDAVGVETLSALPGDYARCGLVKPSFTIAMDVDASGSVRRNVMLGGAAPGGGRYATVGGLDAIFVLSRHVVQSLTREVLK